MTRNGTAMFVPSGTAGHQLLHAGKVRTLAMEQQVQGVPVLS
jgi:hypothetical protein